MLASEGMQQYGNLAWTDTRSHADIFLTEKPLRRATMDKLIYLRGVTMVQNQSVTCKHFCMFLIHSLLCLYKKDSSVCEIDSGIQNSEKCFFGFARNAFLGNIFQDISFKKEDEEEEKGRNKIFKQQNIRKEMKDNVYQKIAKSYVYRSCNKY